MTGELYKERTILDINEEESNVIILKLPNAVGYRSGEKSIVRERIPFEDIIEVKVKSNSSIISTLRGSQLGGALVGRVVAGEIGTIIGGS